MPQPTQPRQSRPPRRWPLALLLTACLAFVGLVAGAAAGALWLVPEGSGLAGPAIVLGWGVLAAGGGVVLGALAGWLAPHRLLRALAVGAAGLCLLAAAVVAWRVVTVSAERAAAQRPATPLPPPADFRIESRIAPLDPMRRYRELAVDGADWTVAWSAVGPERAACRATLSGEEAAALLALRSTLADPTARPGACDADPATASHRYRLEETDPALAGWEIAADARCLQTSAELAQLHRVLGRIPLQAVSDGRAECEIP